MLNINDPNLTRFGKEFYDQDEDDAPWDTAPEPSLTGHYVFFFLGAVLAALCALFYALLPPFWAGFTLALVGGASCTAFWLSHLEMQDYQQAIFAAEYPNTLEDSAASAADIYGLDFYG